MYYGRVVVLEFGQPDVPTAKKHIRSQWLLWAVILNYLNSILKYWLQTLTKKWWTSHLKAHIRNDFCLE
ncbi:hypothetical protein ROBYS_03080 [Roseobacter sp. OBYS 0001]|nr:hypothetical protein ROBYS_03080 [Roseobacter sp. OBYS 0001]